MKKTMKTRLCALLLGSLMTAVLMTGCGKKDEAVADGLTEVNMAFCTFTGYSPMFIAQEQGYFEDAGIHMNIQVIEDESTYASLITKGDIQFLATAQDPNIKMFANGAASRYVLTMDESYGADALVATEGINSLDDLKGKSVALDKSASSYYFFLKALENGSSLTEDDIDVQDMGDTTEAGVAFIGGQVDAAIMWEPELSNALAEVAGAHTIVTSADYPDAISDSLVVNADYAKEHPEIVDAVKKAWYQAVEFYQTNATEAYENMASGFEEVTPEDIESDSAGLRFLGKEENEKLLDENAEGNIYDLCKEMADFWMSKGECKTDELDDYFSLVK